LCRHNKEQIEQWLFSEESSNETHGLATLLLLIDSKEQRNVPKQRGHQTAFSGRHLRFVERCFSIHYRYSLQGGSKV